MRTFTDEHENKNEHKVGSEKKTKTKPFLNNSVLKIIRLIYSSREDKRENTVEKQCSVT